MVNIKSKLLSDLNENSNRIHKAYPETYRAELISLLEFIENNPLINKIVADLKSKYPSINWNKYDALEGKVDEPFSLEERARRSLDVIEDLITDFNCHTTYMQLTTDSYSYPKKFVSLTVRFIDPLINYLDEKINNTSENDFRLIRLGSTDEKVKSTKMKDKRRTPSKSEKNFIIDRQHNNCALCKQPLKAQATHFDHIEPHYKGGKTSIDNLQALCANCHSIKSNNDRLKDKQISDVKPLVYNLPEIRVEMSFGLGKYHEGSIKKLIQLKAINYGHIQVTLSSYWLTLPNKIKLAFLGPRGRDSSEMPGFSFPRKLPPGDVCQVFIDLNDINCGLEKEGFKGDVELIGCYIDTFGTTYKSEKFMLSAIMRD